MAYFVMAILGLIPVQALSAEVCMDGSCSSESVVLGEVEAQELKEATALRMELMQKHVHKDIRTPARSIANDTAAAETTAQTNVTSAVVEEAGAVSLDHNGNVCMLCNKPLPGRTNKNYTEFRTDCGGKSSATGPMKAVLSVPAVQLQETSKTGEVKSNGFCELNFAKSCVDAVANQDYLYWPKSINLNVTASKSSSAWDGRYCNLNGFLEHDIVSLQHDFAGLKKKGESLCKEKYSKYNIDKLSFTDMMTAARYDDETAPKLEEAELLAAWNCAMGDLGCDLALCAYSFCKQGTGVGLYNECEGWDPVLGMRVASQ